MVTIEISSHIDFVVAVAAASSIIRVAFAPAFPVYSLAEEVAGAAFLAETATVLLEAVDDVDARVHLAN